MKEVAIFRNLMRCKGRIPSPDEMSANGVFVRVQQGVDGYEEFRYQAVPMFQIRVKFEDMKASVVVTDL